MEKGASDDHITKSTRGELLSRVRRMLLAALVANTCIIQYIKINITTNVKPPADNLQVETHEEYDMLA